MSPSIGSEERPAPGWPDGIKTITYPCSADSTRQPALFYAPESKKAAPLLVALHTWSSNFRQSMSIPYAAWCVERGWVFVHPNFRGPNRTPRATGSELVVQDILDAVTYARARARVDESRIYLVGASGGGHAALLMAGRAPELWAGVSSWVPISDLALWYEECTKTGRKYADDIVASLGGAPLPGTRALDEARKRSPKTYLQRARSVAIDINAGIRDGHDGSVPISHSLESFNILARSEDRIDARNIAFLVEKAAVPPALARPPAHLTDPSYGNKKPLFRRQSGRVRVTIFDGGHEIIFRAALQWLARQRKPPAKPDQRRSQSRANVDLR